MELEDSSLVSTTLLDSSSKNPNDTLPTKTSKKHTSSSVANSNSNSTSNYSLESNHASNNTKPSTTSHTSNSNSNVTVSNSSSNPKVSVSSNSSNPKVSFSSNSSNPKVVSNTKQSVASNSTNNNTNSSITSYAVKPSNPSKIETVSLGAPAGDGEITLSISNNQASLQPIKANITNQGNLQSSNQKTSFQDITKNISTSVKSYADKNVVNTSQNATEQVTNSSTIETSSTSKPVENNVISNTESTVREPSMPKTGTNQVQNSIPIEMKPNHEIFHHASISTKRNNPMIAPIATTLVATAGVATAMVAMDKEEK